MFLTAKKYKKKKSVSVESITQWSLIMLRSTEFLLYFVSSDKTPQTFVMARFPIIILSLWLELR